MTQPAPLPSLFGRFTAVLRDHEHLGTSLKELRAMCSALEAQRSWPEAPRLLEDLRAELSVHFSAEEADSYFGTIVEESPSLAPRIGQLKQEHESMLVALVALGLLADDATRATELARAARLLIAELERHERAESQLIAELLGHSR
ncbi:MAG: hemerythrin domain-containing protein [Myxococcales bacterium]